MWYKRDEEMIVDLSKARTICVVEEHLDCLQKYKVIAYFPSPLIEDGLAIDDEIVLERFDEKQEAIENLDYMFSFLKGYL